MPPPGRSLPRQLQRICRSSWTPPPSGVWRQRLRWPGWQVSQDGTAGRRLPWRFREQGSCATCGCASARLSVAHTPSLPVSFTWPAAAAEALHQQLAAKRAQWQEAETRAAAQAAWRAGAEAELRTKQEEMYALKGALQLPGVDGWAVGSAARDCHSSQARGLHIHCFAVLASNGSHRRPLRFHLDLGCRAAGAAGECGSQHACWAGAHQLVLRFVCHQMMLCFVRAANQCCHEQLPTMPMPLVMA